MCRIIENKILYIKIMFKNIYSLLLSLENKANLNDVVLQPDQAWAPSF